ncbi:MAG: hypothetical protein ACO1OT_16715 [Heyndrickxia sp.]
MANHPFDENHVKELLRNMPKITDNRNIDDIYWSVQRKMNKKTKSKKIFFIPALSVLAVVILMVLISPVFLKQGEQQSKSTDSSDRKAQVAMSSSKPKAELKKKEQSTVNADQNTKDQISKTAVYNEDLKDDNVFTYGVFTKDAVVVPVSVLAPKEENSDWINQYKTIAKTLAQKTPSLDNYLPLHGDMKYDAATKKLHIIIAKKDIPSINESIQLNLNRIVQYSFANQEVKEVDFSDENGNPIEVGELGEVKSQDINQTPQTAYYLYTSSDGEDYLLPTDETFSNFQAALEAMKTKPDDFHQPVIGQDVDMKVNVENKEQANVQFTNNVQLDKEKNSMDMIEGILLTAKNFGITSIQFKNVEPLQWDGFDFSKPVEVPIAPNKIHLE